MDVLSSLQTELVKMEEHQDGKISTLAQRQQTLEETVDGMQRQLAVAGQRQPPQINVFLVKMGSLHRPIAFSTVNLLTNSAHPKCGSTSSCCFPGSVVCDRVLL